MEMARTCLIQLGTYLCDQGRPVAAWHCNCEPALPAQRLLAHGAVATLESGEMRLAEARPGPEARSLEDAPLGQRAELKSHSHSETDMVAIDAPPRNREDH